MANGETTVSAQLHVVMEQDSGNEIVLGNAKMKALSMNMKNVTWAAVQVNICNAVAIK